MLKELLFVQIAVLSVEIVLGSVLLNQYDADLKTVHGIVGALVGLCSLATVYVALRSKTATAIKSLALAALVFVVLAIIGGKMAGTNYDQGVMLMRTSAVIALVLSIVCSFKLKKTLK